MNVRIVPGLSQDDPPDVMRGEETKVAGFLALNPGWDGTLLLPGTHPKWVAVSGGEVTAFRTSLTGEVFAALAEHTVLRHSFGTGWDEAAFAEGVAEGLARPEQLLNRLFAIRAAGLLQGLAPDAARARASGLLIGADLAGAKGWWLGTSVALLGTGAPADAWAAALTQQGAQPTRLDATEATLAGLATARRLA
jgi:2-dehydro-3-deoxygalactonokinase